MTKKSRCITQFSFFAIIIFVLIALLVNSLTIFTGKATSFIQSPSLCAGQWKQCHNAFANDVHPAIASTLFGSRTGIWSNYIL